MYLGLGTNLGDRLALLRAARACLEPAVHVLRCSAVYETPPWGVADQPTFLNAACMAQTALSPEDLLAHVKSCERQLGRTATYRWGPRAIDIDILLYDDRVLATPTLTIPHPLLHERAFVLVPLSEIASHVLHPLLNRTVAELCTTIDRTGVVAVATL